MPYKLNDCVVGDGDAGFQEFLARAHTGKLRPVCLCRPRGAEMYVARLEGQYIIKRMPDTGHLHSPDCDSYDPPPELSGLGQLVGGAIQNNPSDGTVALKLGFSLAKSTTPRAAPASSGETKPESVKTEGSKLSLRGLLHLLWEHAGFNRWSPSMVGKRTWPVIQRHLKQAAMDKVAKGGNLSEQIYIPEPFYIERKDEISQRRRAQMLRLTPGGKGSKQLMLVVGEVKEIAASRYGHKVVLKHCPDYHFMLADDIHRRMFKAFGEQLAMWDALEDSHLMMVGTFGCGPTGVASIESLALMNVTADWLPFENQFEKELVDRLVGQGRRFLKGMRYNLASNCPMASAVLTDVGDDPVAMYLVWPGAGEEYEQKLNALMTESKISHWVWRVDEAMPDFVSNHIGAE